VERRNPQEFRSRKEPHAEKEAEEEKENCAPPACQRSPQAHSTEEARSPKEREAAAAEGCVAKAQLSEAQDPEDDVPDSGDHGAGEKDCSLGSNHVRPAREDAVGEKPYELCGSEQ
jgi:hypothetical protein